MLSLAIEIPVVGFIVHYAWNLNRRDMILTLCVATIATLLTHPFAWIANEKLNSIFSFFVRASFIECGVIVVESMCYASLRFLRWKRAVALSVIANLLSFFGGLIFYELF